MKQRFTVYHTSDIHYISSKTITNVSKCEFIPTLLDFH